MKYPALALLALSVACASSQNYDGTRTEEDLRLCLKAGPCTVLHVRNDNFADARIYLNGSRFAFVASHSYETLFVPRWRLDSDRCAVIEVRLMVGGTATTSRECVRSEGYYELTIDASTPSSRPNVTLTPYALSLIAEQTGESPGTTSCVAVFS